MKKANNTQVLVVHVCNPSYWEAEISGIKVLRQPGKKVYKIPFQWKKAGMVIHACHPGNGGKHKIGGLWSMMARAKSETLFPKQPELKREA
jgi:hypothetical protein